MLRDDIFNANNDKLNPHKGEAIVADPFLHGKYFGRSVILLTDISDTGVNGLVLNKPLTHEVGDFIPELKDYEFPVFLGGPVETSKLYFIHTLGNLIPQSHHVKANLYWGGDFETLLTLIRQNQVKFHQVRFFVGYSSWAPGQLEFELEEGSWVIADLSSGEMMNTINPKFWEEVMRNLGGKFKVWSNFPDNPSMN